MRQCRLLGILLLLLILAGAPPRLRAADLQPRIQRLTQSNPDRSPGSPGARKSADLLANELAQAAHQPVWRQPFLLALPTVDQCQGTDLTPGAANAPVSLAPLLPSGGQIAALPADLREADILYAGSGTYEELRGQDPGGKFVALDMTIDPMAWRRAAALGARAILFLGDANTPSAAFLNQATDLPVAIPRFYCADPAAVQRLRSGTMKRLRLDIRAGWREQRLENLFCILPGNLNPGQYVILQARYDGSSEVLGRAPAANSAAAPAAVVDLAARIAAARQHITVIVLLTAGDQWNMRGTRAALDLIDPVFKDSASALADLQKNAADARDRLHHAQQILAGLQQFTLADFTALENPQARSTLEDQLLRQSSKVEEQLERSPAGSRFPAAANLQSEKAHLLSAMNVLDPRAPRTALQKATLQAGAAQLLPPWQTEVQRLANLQNALAQWPALRASIGECSPMMFLSLALGSGSPRYGFFARSGYLPWMDYTGKGFAQAFRRYAPPDSGWNRPGFLAESMEKRFTLQSFFPVGRAFSSDAALARGIPAGAFATIGDPMTFFDTPNDTLNHLNFANLQAQENSLADVLIGGPGGGAGAGALTDPAFYVRKELVRLTADQPVTVFERAAGESLPRLKAANCLIGGETEVGPLGQGPPLAGTRREDWYLTYADGTAAFASAFRWAPTRLTALDFGSDGIAIRALAGNQQEVREMASSFSADPDRNVRCMIFDARRLDCYGLFDPRFLDTLDRLDVLDAQRLDHAQFSNVYAADGMASVFLPPDIRWQILAARGAFNNRMLLIHADAQNPTGDGFATTDLRQLGPLPWRNVLDLETLNGRRQSDLEKFGISSAVVTELQAAAKPRIAAAREAEKKRDYPAFFANADAAWSLEAQIYQTLIDTSNGIIKGVIFLLLGIIPFSYFLERLLIGAATIYRQLLGFAVIFAAMTAALWFHPALRISSAPLMILLAFLILILSSAVVYILWGKFEEEIARLRSSRAGGGAGARGGMGGGASHSTSLRRGAVLGAAVRLGLSNMRRRGTRTALTLLTLVLLTFTLLCFTSVTELVRITPRRIVMPGAGASTPPPPMPAGILLRARGWSELPAQAIEWGRGLTLATEDGSQKAEVARESGEGVIATRWWYSSDQPEEPWLLPVQPENPRRRDTPPFFAAALVGLDAAEADFQAVSIDGILPGFARLGERADICWLPVEAQNNGAIAAGDVVTISGRKLTVAGFFDDAGFRQLRQLTGDPLSPIDLSGPGGSNRNGAGDESQAGRAPEASYRFLSSSTLAIVPAHLVRELGGRLTSIMIRPGKSGPAAAGIFAAAEALARRSAFTIYASDGRQVRSINASRASEPRDFGAVLVPMLMAGVIILNTMLGAVSERTREIHVYTSIGLAPSHVGMLFLAEAAALGTIGVVAGYIFGQGLATVLSYTRLLPGVDLNYSSMSAIVTMGLVMGLVMLSALWPARAASRLAAPSLERHWKLPKPIGDVLYVELPFTVNETAARGVVAFIAEFLYTTTQTGGRFTADAITPFESDRTCALPPARPGSHATPASPTASLPAGPPVRGLTARIWLAPYDLGVIQSIRLEIIPTEQSNIFDVHLELTREAGNPATWRRLNRPFLVEIRKQFLLWRNLAPAQIAAYLERSATLFHNE